ncbi:hypothetical protein ACFBZI_12035 [Moraxella sp. ZJ142]|uniref:hypothetical protein n=1 Tax=Moraxella marmotae TaxID=3344520 RepID=UPI0035D45FEA
MSQKSFAPSLLPLLGVLLATAIIHISYRDMPEKLAAEVWKCRPVLQRYPQTEQGKKFQESFVEATNGSKQQAICNEPKAHCSWK